MSEPRTGIEEAVEAWESKGATSLTVALVADALYGARDTIARVDAVLREAEEGAGIWGTCSGEWLRIKALRAALDQESTS